MDSFSNFFQELANIYASRDGNEMTLENNRKNSELIKVLDKEDVAIMLSNSDSECIKNLDKCYMVNIGKTKRMINYDAQREVR